MAKFDIFICYRRDNGEKLARLIKDALKVRGFKVFMDVEDLKSGDFSQDLYEKIEEATDIIVVLTADCLKRCEEEDDFVRHEIRHAIEKQKNIIPVFEKNFQMNSLQELPSDISKLSRYNGLTPTHEMFEASMDRLVNVYLKSKKKSNRALIILSVLFLVCIIFFAFFKFNNIIFQQKSITGNSSIKNNNPSTTSGILKGKITDDITGEPILDANIYSYDLINISTFSNSNGNYFVDDIPIGKYVIKVSKPIMQPLPKSGFASVIIKEGQETIKDIKIQATKFALTTNDNRTFIMELQDVMPSLKGTANLSLTKNTSEIVDNIIWETIRIREYGDDIWKVKEIKIIGKPKVFKFPQYSDPYYFYPIQIIYRTGQTETWYWQGKTLIGYEVSDNNLTTQVGVPLSTISRMVFIHEND